MRVRVNSLYIFRPTWLDLLDNRRNIDVASGTKVRVINMQGCPKANTMNHCYIETLGGDFIGLVSCDSLSKE